MGQWEAVPHNPFLDHYSPRLLSLATCLHFRAVFQHLLPVILSGMLEHRARAGRAQGKL